MKDLLAMYTIDEIILFIVLLAAAFKGVLSFYDWFIDRKNKGETTKSEKREKQKNVIDKVDKLYELQLDQEERMAKMMKAIDLLTDSDKDNIKAWITERHHYFCYEIKAIDYFSLDSIERRYEHYKQENGNSYIDTLIKELKELPKIETEAIMATEARYTKAKQDKAIVKSKLND